MDFTITAIFAESATIELCNNDIYEMKEALPVVLNGRELFRTTKNVFTVTGLSGDTSYQLKIGENEKTFHTLKTGFKLNVLDFGATGDGTSNDTAALQAAIMACPEFGCVYVPAGTYLTGPVFLKSHMTLQLAEDAVLLGDPDREHYPILPGMIRNWESNRELNLGTWEGNPLDVFASLITAINCEDVDIVGPGVLDGNAKSGDWWNDPKVKRVAWRPNTLFLCRCKNVRVSNITVRNSPSWTVHPYYSENLQFLNMKIENPYHSPNTDGFDPESCKDVLLLGSEISVGDDCIAIKSGKYYMSMNHYAETRGVEIRNCRLAKGHGSVTIGSEIAGGVYDVHVTKCRFEGTDRGMRIKTRRGRGERSVLTNIVFEKIEMDGVRMPITLNMFYFCDPDGHSEYVQDQGYREADHMTPTIGRIELKDSKCVGVGASFVCAVGLPEKPIENVVIENVSAVFASPEDRIEEVPVMMDGFPKMSGCGIYLQNVAVAKLKNITLAGSSDNAPILKGAGDAVCDNVNFVETM